MFYKPSFHLKGEAETTTAPMVHFTVALSRVSAAGEANTSSLLIISNHPPPPPPAAFTVLSSVQSETCPVLQGGSSLVEDSTLSLSVSFCLSVYLSLSSCRTSCLTTLQVSPNTKLLSKLRPLSSHGAA